MDVFAAFVMFAILSAATWFVSVAVYRSLFTGHDPAARRATGGSRRSPYLRHLDLLSAVPGRLHPGSRGLGVDRFRLPRPAALEGSGPCDLLATGSFLTRLRVLGALELF